MTLQKKIHLAIDKNQTTHNSQSLKSSRGMSSAKTFVGLKLFVEFYLSFDACDLLFVPINQD